MTTGAGRRNQNTDGAIDFDNFDLDGLLEKQIKQEESRKLYQERPEVKAKRQDYQNKQAVIRKVTRAAMRGDKPALMELGMTEEQADTALTKAKSMVGSPS